MAELTKSSPRASVWAAIITMALAIATSSALWIYHKGQSGGTRTITILGAVVDGKTRKPVPFARVQMETLGPDLVEPVYTDSNGNFSIALKSKLHDNAAVLRVTASGLTQSENIDLGESAQAHISSLILLATKESGDVGGPAQEPKHIERTLGPVPSGYAANWSDWYTLCIEADKGFKIQQVSFSLAGDRTCNGWAQCEPLAQSPSQACWHFRMQGHSESSSVGYSLGRISAEEVPSGTSQSEKSKYLISLQYHDQTEGPFVEGLRAELVRQGYTVPEPELLEKNYPTVVRFFHSEDQAAAETLQGLIGTMSQQSGRPLTPALQDFSKQYSTLPGQIEIWVNFSRQ